MPDHIKIRTAPGHWVVRAGGAIVGETDGALELAEAGYPEVIYFPRANIAMAFMDASETTSHCPHKGDATYFSVVTKSTTLADVAWSYEAPHADMARIAGHIAFFPEKGVTVEKL